MSTRPKLVRRGLWASVRSKTLKKKGKKDDDSASLGQNEVEIIFGRIRVVLAHLEENAQSESIAMLGTSGGNTAETKEAALALVDALSGDDVSHLVRTLQRFSCGTLGQVVKLALMSNNAPLISGKVCQLLLNLCQKYAEYFDERIEEKVEEMGATLERFANQGNLEVVESLCKCLQRLPVANDELAYIFAPLVMLPKLHMLMDESASEEDLNACFELLASADGVIEVMEFMVSKADVLFCGRSRKRALLDKGISGRNAISKSAQEELEQKEGAKCLEGLDEEEAFPCGEGDELGLQIGNIPSASNNSSKSTRSNSDSNSAFMSSPTSTAFSMSSSARGAFMSSKLASSASAASSPCASDSSFEGSFGARHNSGAAILAPKISPPPNNGTSLGSPRLAMSSPRQANSMSFRSEMSRSIASEDAFAGWDLKDPVCTATALFDYEPVEDGEIALKRGETVEVLLVEDDGWWYGRGGDGVVGVFPGLYVQRNDESAGLQGAAASPRSTRSISSASSSSGLEIKCRNYEALLKNIANKMAQRVNPGSESAAEDFSMSSVNSLVNALFDKMDKLEEENSKLKRIFVKSPSKGGAIKPVRQAPWTQQA